MWVFSLEVLDVVELRVMGRLVAYPSDRIVSASREMSSSNWVFFTPSVSIREVKRP